MVVRDPWERFFSGVSEIQRRVPAWDAMFRLGTERAIVSAMGKLLGMVDVDQRVWLAHFRAVRVVQS